MTIAKRMSDIAAAVERDTEGIEIQIEHDLHAGAYAIYVDAAPIAYLHANEGPITLSIVDADGDVLDEIIEPTAQQIVAALISER